MRFSLRCATGTFSGGAIQPQDSITGLQSYGPGHYNKTPVAIGLALLLHAVVIFMAVYSPMNLFRRPKFVETYSVNLFRVTDFETTSPRSISPPPVDQSPATRTRPGEIISLAPRKLKKKNNALEKLKKNEDLIKKRLASIKADLAAKKAEQEAQAAAREAVNKLAGKIRGKNFQPEGQGAEGTANSTLSEAQKAYIASVHSHILNKWVLPNLPDWDKSLEAIVVLKINRQGKIIKSFFEKKTDNAYFNKFVEKTISDSDPLPPIPDAFHVNEMEIGLRFRPGEIL